MVFEYLRPGVHMFEFLVAVIACGVGVGAGYVIRKNVAQKQTDSAESKAQKILAEAKDKEKEILLQAKDKALAMIDEAKQEEQARRKELSHSQQRLEKRESLFDKKLLELETKQEKIQEKAEEIRQVKEKIEDIKKQQFAKLEEVAGMTREDAKDVLLKNVERSISDALQSRRNKLEAQASLDIQKKSQEILTMAIERYAGSHVVENSTAVIDLPSDEMKGRVIGREGRNIRTFERLTGVDIIIDDTPQAITISCFSPIRREVAKRALQKLIQDGRIHPARIEEMIIESKKELALEIQKAGEEAVYELGIVGYQPKLVQVIGRLKYRTSYGQNILQHSIEVARIAAYLASELGANVENARQGGLLHDLGKAFDHEIQGTHPEIGYDIGKKFNLNNDILSAIREHHEDKPSTLVGVIVKIADMISGARPGARRDTQEDYIQRLAELENISTSFEGVDKAYAVHAGREIRVFVQPDAIDDAQSYNLAKSIAERIEDELKYPGEIKVNVIREKRVIEYAR